MQQHKITEGLTRGALENLVLPLVSIDEFESKISDKRAIVVGFYVGDEDPAIDLSNFVDKSSLPILDTEVSPAPTPEGQYVVFVEIQRNDQFPEILLGLINDINNLASLDSWTFQCPSHLDPVDLTEENIINLVVLNQDDILEIPDHMEKDAEEDAIAEAARFWVDASVDSFFVGKDHVVLEHAGKRYKLSVVEADNNDTAIIPDSEHARRMQPVLGPAYAVFGTPAGLIIEHRGNQKFVQILD